jgi:hypothetical protein
LLDVVPLFFAEKNREKVILDIGPVLVFKILSRDQLLNFKVKHYLIVFFLERWTRELSAPIPTPPHPTPAQWL